MDFFFSLIIVTTTIKIMNFTDETPFRSRIWSDPAIFGQKCYGQGHHQGGPRGATPQNLQDCLMLVIILNMSTRDRKTPHSELKYYI